MALGEALPGLGRPPRSPSCETPRSLQQHVLCSPPCPTLPCSNLPLAVLDATVHLALANFAVDAEPSRVEQFDGVPSEQIYFEVELFRERHQLLSEREASDVGSRT